MTVTWNHRREAWDKDSDDVVYSKYGSNIVEAYNLFESAWAQFFF